MMPFHRWRKVDEKEGFIKRPESREPGQGKIQPKADVNDSFQSGILQLQKTIGNRAVGQLVKEHSVSPELPIQLELEKDELCPGSEIASEGHGKGEGFGQGQGPLGVPKEEEGWI